MLRAKFFWGYRIINFEKKEKILQMHYECCAYVPLKTSGGPRLAGFLAFKVPACVLGYLVKVIQFQIQHEITLISGF